jgi:hypothetical protein
MISSDEHLTLDPMRFEREDPAGSVRYLIDTLLMTHARGQSKDRISLCKIDTIVSKNTSRLGGADVLVFHVDGPASVIVAKTGACGSRHVLEGLGQVALCAAQVAATKGVVREIRRCLMWSSTGSVIVDGRIEEACEKACVVALPMPSISAMKTAIAAMQRSRNVVNG